MSRIDIAELKEREYWTCGQAARVLGRSPGVWSALFDAGHVRGYRTEGGRREINADSARAYLESLSPHVEQPAPKPLNVGALMARFNKGLL